MHQIFEGKLPNYLIYGLSVFLLGLFLIDSVTSLPSVQSINALIPKPGTLPVLQDKSVSLSDSNLTIEVFATGLKLPTNIAFLDSGDALVLEKGNGTVRKIVNGTPLSEPLLDLNVATFDTRGMLGIAVARNETLDKQYIYLYYTEAKNGVGDGEDKCIRPSKCLPEFLPNGNRLYRYELSDDGTKLINQKLIFSWPPFNGASHNGGEIIIGPDNNLYVLTGDGDNKHTIITNSNKSTEIDGRGGILAFDHDGNPAFPKGIIGDANLINKYFAYGIRNGFGLDFDPVTGKLWDTENGPDFGDEINLVEPGFNSGWRNIMGSGNSSNSTENSAVNLNDLILFNGKGKYSAPEFVWKRNVGPTAIKFFDSIKLGKNYENTIFVGEFHSGKILNFKLNENRTLLESGGTKLKTKVNESELESNPFTFAEGFGGVVDIQTGQDGYLYILSLQYGGEQCRAIKFECMNYSSNYPGTIYRITPK